MELPEEVTADLRRRLRRVGGQISGIEKMLDEGRECRDVVMQLSAATRALEQVGFKLVSAGMRHCLGNSSGADADSRQIAELEQLFLKLA